MTSSSLSGTLGRVRCACGRAWSREAWIHLPLVEYWTVLGEARGADTLELRDCACGNRLGRVMKEARLE